MFTSLITLGLSIITYLILVGIFASSGVKFNVTQFITLGAIFGVITIVFLIVFAISPHNKIKDLPKFINTIEIALIITISTIIICFAISAINEIDFKSMPAIFNNLILPSVTSLSIPVFFIAQYLLSKLEYFQSF